MSLGHIILVLVVYTLATARVTKLTTSDMVTDPLRLALARRARNPDASESEKRRWATAVFFAECSWCTGWWICLAGAYPVVRLIGWPAWALVPVALAASYLIGVASPLTAEDIEVTETE